MVRRNERSPQPPPGTQSVCRALELLVALGTDKPQMTVSELAARTGLHISTASRLLGALRAYDLVVVDPKTQHVQLGPRCYQLGQVFVSQTEVVDVAEPFMRNLTAEFGQPTHLGILHENRVVHIRHVEPEGYVMRLSAAERYALGEVYCEALGKVLVAFQPDDAVDRILDSIRFVRYTRRTITSKNRMLREIRHIRQRGYAIDHGERYEDVRCVAVPLRDHTGRVFAGLSVSGTPRQMTTRHIHKLAQRMLEVAEAISHRMGAPPARLQPLDRPARPRVAGRRAGRRTFER